MSTAPLFLVDTLPDADEVDLTGDEGRHAARVRRLTAGEPLVLGDGHGALLDCVVAAVRPAGLHVRVTARRTVSRPDPRIVVVQALPKGDRAELAVETMTELGVDEIVPWPAARSVTRWEGSRGDKALQRWRRTAREAAKQSRRAWVPGVTDPASTEEIARRCPAALVLHEAATTPLSTAAVPSSGALVVVVGPEGGISDAELDRFVAAGATTVRLGDAVLRTSTAGAAALAVLSVRLGRWS
ncbi:MAG TPA: 16S rRNA (uracil(1498)-N(3))-methyltransferase [Jatrophihabitantaceae bacterium]